MPGTYGHQPAPVIVAEETLLVAAAISKFCAETCPAAETVNPRFRRFQWQERSVHAQFLVRAVTVTLLVGAPLALATRKLSPTSTRPPVFTESDPTRSRRPGSRAWCSRSSRRR